MLPLNCEQGKEEFGIFALNDIPKNTTLWENGLFDRNHSTVCSALGVQVEGEPARRKGRKMGVRRHILSFLHKDNFGDESDMGSEANSSMMWCDLAANCSPTLFLNSVDPDNDSRLANAIFTEVKMPNNLCMSVTKTTRPIAAGEEILSSYLSNGAAEDTPAPPKKKQKTKL